MRIRLFLAVMIILIDCLACNVPVDKFPIQGMAEVIPELTPTPVMITFNGWGSRKIRVIQTGSSEYMGVFVAAGRMFFAEEMCVRLNMKNLWQPGDTAEFMDRHYSSDENVIILVNDLRQSLANGNTYTESGLTLNLVFDERKSQIGTYEPIGSYGDLTWCFNTVNLGVGVYELSVTLKTTSGDEYSHHWKFEILNGFE